MTENLCLSNYSLCLVWFGILVHDRGNGLPDLFQLIVFLVSRVQLLLEILD